MKFVEALSTYDAIVENGPLGTRLQYDYGLKLGANLTVTDLIGRPDGQKALSELYRGDIDVAQAQDVPIIVNAATFRASRDHLRLSNFEDIRHVNLTCINFVKAIRDSYPPTSAPIFVAAPVGSMHDAYSIDNLPTIEAAQHYHQEQMKIFKEADVDFVNAVTLSSLSEALGIALAAQQSDLDYTIGFILNERATLLDGTSLLEAIRQIDQKTTKKPLGYLITCTHSSVIAKLPQPHEEYQRLIGVQANGSNLPSKQLAAMEKPVADPPAQFAQDLGELKRDFNLKILGGCCGTSRDHLEEIIQQTLSATLDGP